MELVNAVVIERFGKKHHDARKWLASWTVVVKASAWKNIIDVRKQFPHADAVLVRWGIATVFNVKGNEYRLITAIDYGIQRVIIVAVMAHSEYDEDRWKK